MREWQKVRLRRRNSTSSASYQKRSFMARTLPTNKKHTYSDAYIAASIHTNKQALFGWNENGPSHLQHQPTTTNDKRHHGATYTQAAVRLYCTIEKSTTSRRLRRANRMENALAGIVTYNKQISDIDNNNSNNIHHHHIWTSDGRIAHMDNRQQDQRIIISSSRNTLKNRHKTNHIQLNKYNFVILIIILFCSRRKGYPLIIMWPTSNM